MTESERLIEFLYERIGHDLSIALDALVPSEMHPYGDKNLPVMTSGDVPDAMREYLGGRWGEHAANWHMKRAINESKAKLRLISRVKNFAQDMRTHGPVWFLYEEFVLSTLSSLAMPYQDHPDFKIEWTWA